MKKISFLEKIGSSSNLTWIISGFIIAYLFLFIYQTFINVNFMLIPEYIPRFEPIGSDLKNTLDISRDWFSNKTPIYDQPFPYPYTPFVALFVIPLTYLGNSLAYRIITLINLLCYIGFLVLFGKKVKDNLLSPIFTFILITGLFSYGFLFELERGQFNIIAASLCFLAIYIFHNKEKYRWISYLLFIISVQLKIWPAMFIFMFVVDWKDWINNLKRFFILAVVNFGMLFILGLDNFKNFLGAMAQYAQYKRLPYADHSILSFASSLTGGTRFMGSQSNTMLQLVLFVLMIITVLCILLLIYHAYRMNIHGLNQTLLLACTIGALIIPISYDYTLSILPVPVLLVLMNDGFWNNFKKINHQITAKLLMLLFSISYASTLFSFSYRPFQKINGLFASNFLALFIMLVILVIVQFLHGVKRQE